MGLGMAPKAERFDSGAAKLPMEFFISFNLTRPKSRRVPDATEFPEACKDSMRFNEIKCSD